MRASAAARHIYRTDQHRYPTVPPPPARFSCECRGQSGCDQKNSPEETEKSRRREDPGLQPSEEQPNRKRATGNSAKRYPLAKEPPHTPPAGAAKRAGECGAEHANL